MVGIDDRHPVLDHCDRAGAGWPRDAEAAVMALLAAPHLAGRRYGVFGLARSGLATLGFLRRSGADVVAWDDREAARDAARAAFPGLALADPMAGPLDGLAGLVVAPGVPLNTHPLAARARAAGIPLIGDVELFQDARRHLPAHRVVGITGTNGKSTCAALLHHLLVSAGRVALLGGNIGNPILGETALPEGGIHVLELSSFQIDLCRTLACDVAVLLNVTPDHLDRYPSMQAYAAAKARLFAMQEDGAHAIIADEDRFAACIAASLPPRLVLRRVRAADALALDRSPALAGPHNAQNAACAIAAARLMGVSLAEIAAGLRTYPGLPHRMERVAEIAGVAFVNDSKATNAESAAPALAAFERVHWIAGGAAKTDNLDPCLPHLGHVRRAWLIGDAAPLFARILAPHVPVTRAGTLEQAVAGAAAAAVAGEVVLLSPACASFDQFASYEARGAAFRAAVAERAAAKGEARDA
jgi:UDP-N-acetylmuramoylalanine--D-glutamate ligase